jgi:methylated-DNA-[protein]-cysteine S-methyltransferase
MTFYLPQRVFNHPILGNIKLLGSTSSGLIRVQLNVEDCDILDPDSDDMLLLEVEKRLLGYFEGHAVSFEDITLNLGQGTPFQQKVWKTLMEIPYGQTRNYQWLAEAISRPKAMRAVGNANGKNPFPLILPCHRVIQKNGALGGYTGGTWIKNYLLALEQHGPKNWLPFESCRQLVFS